MGHQVDMALRKTQRSHPSAFEATGTSHQTNKSALKWIHFGLLATKGAHIVGIAYVGIPKICDAGDIHGMEDLHIALHPIEDAGKTNGRD
ncbi:hypothetical protein CAMM_01645 [Corynebacterium ammoniagenes DSM 20306]|uniref:Uncharacterized protein n=1 Tax=Corynebacterium ammoniagenes DSM 20306 TaxID=649754 RepID=A0ABP2IFB4_CORAM|nr:hypothetical protein CAMM_01645 [Corynebacterium ammoniagenes DSM 20306]AQS72803.1 hypothetical protein CA40472_01985 [Corynebacterium ammoniagenes]EFG82213.1 hypothetical protein HMPREF0281_00591 [Corynebacterium ammoniagenes DSM 20306]